MLSVASTCAPLSVATSPEHLSLLQQEEEEMRQEAERMQREADLKKEQEAERLRKLEEAAEKQRQREKEIEERAVSCDKVAQPNLSLVSSQAEQPGREARLGG